MPLLIFNNTRDVIRAEASLMERGVDVTVVPLSDARCGMGLRVDDDQIQKVETALKETNIMFNIR